MLEDKDGNVVGTDSQEYDTLGIGEQIGGDVTKKRYVHLFYLVFQDHQISLTNQLRCSHRWSIGGFDWTSSQQLHQVCGSGELRYQ